MGVPYKKRSAKQLRQRRAMAYYKMDTPGMATCSACGSHKLPHRVCLKCGTYNGRKVFASVEES